MITLEKSTLSSVSQVYWTAEIRIPLDGARGTRKKVVGIGPTPLDATMALAEYLARELSK